MRTTTTRFAGLALILFSATALDGVREPAPRPSRTFSFVYDVSLKDLPPDVRSAKIWIPEATSDAGQTVTLKGVSGPVRTVETRDPEYGNRILYAELSKPEATSAHFTVNYLVTRREYDGESPAAASADPLPASRFLRADHLVPIDGRMKELAEEITRGKSDSKEVARAIYDYVFKTLRYDKTGTGWGRGDAVWACDAKRGNCTDFHSLFIALMRAKNIPARFEIGFPLPAKSAE